MKAKLAQADSYLKGLSGTRLFYFVTLCIVICLTVGIFVGYIYTLVRTPKPELQLANSNITVGAPYYEGRIDYIDPRLYPGKNVSFVLVSPHGKVLYFLKSDNSVLEVAEGQTARVYGDIEKKKGSEEHDTIMVSKIVIKSSEN